MNPRYALMIGTPLHFVILSARSAVEGRPSYDEGWVAVGLVIARPWFERATRPHHDKRSVRYRARLYISHPERALAQSKDARVMTRAAWQQASSTLGRGSSALRALTMTSEACVTALDSILVILSAR